MVGERCRQRIQDVGAEGSVPFCVTEEFVEL